MLTVFLLVQGFDKGVQSVGKAKTRFRKAPKSENVYIKLLVKVCILACFCLVVVFAESILTTAVPILGSSYGK